MIASPDAEGGYAFNDTFIGPFVYPFRDLGKIESHLNPFFAVFNAGFKLNQFQREDLTLVDIVPDDLFLEAERIQSIFEKWMSDIPPPPSKGSSDSSSHRENTPTPSHAIVSHHSERVSSEKAIPTVPASAGASVESTYPQFPEAALGESRGSRAESSKTASTTPSKHKRTKTVDERSIAESSRSATVVNSDTYSAAGTAASDSSKGKGKRRRASGEVV